MNYLHACMHAWYIRAHIRTYVQTYIHTCTHTYINTHTHTHTHNRRRRCKHWSTTARWTRRSGTLCAQSWRSKSKALLTSSSALLRYFMILYLILWFYFYELWLVCFSFMNYDLFAKVFVRHFMTIMIFVWKINFFIFIRK